MGGDFLKRFWNTKTIYIPTPTWPNHNGVFNACDLEIKQYRYYDAKAIGLDIEGMLADLRAAKEGSVILLHACAHNPTGVDPTREDWERILEVVKEKQLLPFFDAAYLGFASGDYDHDAYAIRHFVDAGITLLLAVSFAKNMVRPRCYISDGRDCMASGPVLLLCIALQRRKRRGFSVNSRSSHES